MQKNWDSLQSHWPPQNPWSDPFTLGQMKFVGRAPSRTHVQRKAPGTNTVPLGWWDYGWHLLSLFLAQIFIEISGTGNALARSVGTKQGPVCHNRCYSQGGKQCAHHGNSNAAWSRVTCLPRLGVESSQQYRFPLPPWRLSLPISGVSVAWTTKHARRLSALPRCLWISYPVCEPIYSLCYRSHFAQEQVQRARRA